MKCIYSNAENELTLSDIITYAITGAKVTKSFVCKAHNSFTNDAKLKEIKKAMEMMIEFSGNQVDEAIIDKLVYKVSPLQRGSY